MTAPHEIPCEACHAAPGWLAVAVTRVVGGKGVAMVCGPCSMALQEVHVVHGRRMNRGTPTGGTSYTGARATA